MTALRRKFYGIGQNIYEDLPDAPIIGAYQGKSAADGFKQLNSCVRSLRFDEPLACPNYNVEIDILLVKLKLPGWTYPVSVDS